MHVLKKITWVVFGCAFLVLGFEACKKLKKYTEFDINNSSSFTIPASNYFINVPFEINTPETTTNIQEKIDTEGSASKLVDQVTLTQMNLAINTPANGNFNFLNSVEIYLSSASQPEILAAWKYEISENNSKILDLVTGNTNLKEYIKDSGLTLRVKIVTDKLVPYNLDVTANETFHVKAKLKNIFNK